MGRKGNELTPNVKEVAVHVIKKFREQGTIENIKRSRRPCLIKERDYRSLERLVKSVSSRGNNQI